MRGALVLILITKIYGASQVARGVKNPSVYAEIRDSGLIPGSGRCFGGGHGNSLEYSPEEPGGVQSIGSQRVGHD